MNFIADNWMLITIALSSGFFLLLPVMQGAATSGLSPTEAVQCMNREKGVVVDVCGRDEYAQGHIKGALNVPLDQLEANLGQAVKNKSTPLILSCASGMRSKRAQAIAQKLGYEKVHSLQGGLKAWKEANLPVTKA
ncbi:MAG: sulfurtransferase [Burkholderiales bacterium 35-55-47]|uniref:rhodanese-like domain-containing protein n=1 Tax=Limnohabitans sp. TaxID=1907725 RepID=UPI000BD431C3|nr:rhodanese-like domain-containing protein [Limnohabitans sp.]OYY20498.1 MAG: sulfurtransferase [Burkholderiales bacterium 35-55-47]OYZ74874.1 MAG: sulfurtransferase [Burkholderiales bacterium 24-55-52]OZB02218.1 MAG: sulfurtransferase [Burkholderiales bacterium 39-55-53]HQR86532.1 rhodanese-like domain-containing protein [Limnohabitans sp.]HQS28051.1 rhodanese-like domain-containing protein [Limnohabitans sp.]